MESIVNALFVVLWMVLGFLVLRWLGRFVFHERYRAELAAAALVLAFTVGAIWPFSERIRPSTESAAAPAAAPAAPPSQPVPGQDVSRLCRTATLKAAAGHGSVDVLGVRTGDQIVPFAGNGSVKQGDVLAAEGWVADQGLTQPASGVCLVVDGALVRDASSVYGGTRRDVAAAFHRDTLTNTGFAVFLPASKLVPGAHVISVAAVAADGSAYLITGGRTISRS